MLSLIKSTDEIYNKLIAEERPGVGRSETNLDANGVYMASPYSFISWYVVRNMLKQNNSQRNYALGYAFAHEFLHQIIWKSYTYINDSIISNPYPPNLEGTDGGHVIEIRNLNFPGDGLAFKHRHSEKIVQDEDISSDGILNNPATEVLFTKYLPKSNKAVLSSWEKITSPQVNLLTMCYTLRLIEEKYGKEDLSFILLQESFKKKIKSDDFTNP